jgi:glycosyltransferase involved in cell wall biosynthesis
MHRLVVALPARNCASTLPGWFEAVERFADAVVALDDGSTDDTAEILAAHPLTAVVLRNPVRSTYRGWDDAANRQRLVDACADLRPEWLLQLDADERLADGDGEALRRAIAQGALDPEAAYLLRILRMVDGDDLPGEQRYDQDHTLVGRLFAWRPGVRLPSQRLHLVPLPVDIPRARWTATTLRICHDGSRTAAHRSARVEKYREADPDDRWGSDYARLLAEPATTTLLRPRAPSLPVIPNDSCPGEREDVAGHPEQGPLLTAVVIARDDAAVIERAVGAIVDQQVSGGLQVVVVTSGRDDSADIVRRRFPEVEVVELDHPALPGEARNAGLARARGRYVTFPGSHVVMAPGSLDARVRWHLDGWGMVTGTTCNGTRTAAGWASYFLDHSGGLPDRPSHRMTVAPSYASYLTDAVRYVGGFPEDMRTAEDTMVNTELFDLGYGAWRGQDVRMTHHSPCVDIRTLLGHHFRRGRGRGTMILRRHRSEDGPVLTRRRLVNLGVREVPGRMRRIHRNTWAFGGDLRLRWLVVSPLALSAVTAAWAGAWYELLRPRPGARQLLFQDRLTVRSLRARFTSSPRRPGGGRAGRVR